MKFQRNAQKETKLFGCFGQIVEVVDDVLKRVDFDEERDDVAEVVADAMDDELIYYSQQWTIMQHYQNPEEANLGNALECFFNDLVACLDVIDD